MGTLRAVKLTEQRFPCNLLRGVGKGAHVWTLTEGKSCDFSTAVKKADPTVKLFILLTG